MNAMTKAAVVTLIHLLIVASLGGKLLYDRRTRPQAWFKSQRFDPSLPIRGRYLSLQLELADSRSPDEVRSKFASEIAMYENQPYARFYQFGRECGNIEVKNGIPVARFEETTSGWQCGNVSFARRRVTDHTVLQVTEPVLFFIPDTAKDPSARPGGEELWVLATIPRKGPPRPIALGFKKAGDNNVTRLSVN